MNPRAWSFPLAVLVMAVVGADRARALSVSVAESPSAGAFPLVTGTPAPEVLVDRRGSNNPSVFQAVLPRELPAFVGHARRQQDFSAGDSHAARSRRSVR